MLPDWKDVTDVRDALLYYLGVSEQRPMFRRFSYAEKAEYWALVWGMFVMATTGLMTWFKVLHRRAGAGLVDRCRHHDSLVRSDTGDAGHHRLALVRRDLRSRCLSHELGPGLMERCRSSTTSTSIRSIRWPSYKRSGQRTKTEVEKAEEAAGGELRSSTSRRGAGCSAPCNFGHKIKRYSRIVGCGSGLCCDNFGIALIRSHKRLLNVCGHAGRESVQVRTIPTAPQAIQEPNQPGWHRVGCGRVRQHYLPVFSGCVRHVSSPYVGILAYMVAPAIMIVGLIVIPIGMVMERRRRHHGRWATHHITRVSI